MSRHWTEDETASLVHKRDVEHMAFQDIGRDLKRSTSSCESKYNVLKNEWAPLHKDGWSGKCVSVSAEAIKDRDERYQLKLRQSPTAALLGDPLPGCSALDQKRRDEGINP